MSEMRSAGSVSWRFAEGIEQTPLVALFVRDTLDLDVPAGLAIPPRLEGELPDLSSLLDLERRASAATGWAGWWQAIAALDIRGHQGPPTGEDQHVWLRRLASQHQSVFDPPEFASLATQPALAEALRATFDRALSWADARRQALLAPPEGRHGQFDYDIVRAAAEEVARQHGVSAGEVSGCAMVLPVQGVWWTRFAPGAAICSVHAGRDPAIARIMLTDAFESGFAS